MLTAAIVRKPAVSVAIAGLIVALVAAAWLRFADLSARSLWSDELFSIYFSGQGPSYILGEGARIETNPPLYYLLLWGWMKLWGNGEVAVRSLSAALSMLAIIPIFRVGAILQGQFAARAAVALFAVSGVQVYFAREARPYALFLLAAMWAMAELAALLAEHGSGAARRSRTAVPMLILASIAAIYAHDVGFILAAAIDAVLVGSLAMRPTKRLCRIVLAYNLCVVLAALPQLSIILHQLHSPNIAWIGSGLVWAAGAFSAAETGFSIVDALFALRSDAMSADTFGLVLAGMLALACLMLWFAIRGLRRHRRWEFVALAAFLPAAVLLMLVGISHFRPILLDRTVFWLMPCLFWAVAIGLAATARAGTRYAAFVSMLLLESVFCAAYFHYGAGEPWRALVGDLAREIRPGDVVVVTQEQHALTPATALVYYWRGARPLALRRWAGCSPCAETAEAALDRRAIPAPSVTLAQIRQLLLAGTGVWTISHAPFADDRAELAPLLAAAGAVARPDASFDWRGQVFFTRWQR